MATAPSQAQVLSPSRQKYAVFGVVALMIAYVLWHNERFLIQPDNPVWQHYQPFRWWLLPHGIAGACAIFLGPLQFSDRLRQKYTKMHRVIGRFYVAGALIAAPLGAYIQFFEERMGEARSFSLAATVDACLLMVTTGIAFAFILNGKVQQHRQWMTRSFAVALVFLEVRVIIGVTGWERLGSHAVETTVWSCLAFSLLAADIVLQVQEFNRTRKPLVKAAAVNL